MDCRIPLFDRERRVKAWALVDEEDFWELNGYRWHLSGLEGYVTRRVPKSGGLKITMHRHVLGLEPGDPREGDHINRDPLDNRRSNLRVVNDLMQGQNRSAWGASGVRGASLVRRTGKYRAVVKTEGQSFYLGSFRFKEEAGAVCREFRLKHMAGAVD
jgi:hypothetical protein